jgi:hypothetical protein
MLAYASPAATTARLGAVEVGALESGQHVDPRPGVVARRCLQSLRLPALPGALTKAKQCPSKANGALKYLCGVFGLFMQRNGQKRDIAGYRINPVRLGHAQLRQYCFYASFETRNQIRTPQTELNGVVLCPKLSSLLLG